MYREIKPTEIKDNLIDIIKNEWMLITAGNKDAYNMMTASWGFMGEMWGNDCAAVVVRPQRYTMEFLEREDFFSLSFYGDDKAIHAVCGRKSGRDTDKTEETGLTPVFADGTVYFAEARLVLICRKQYSAPLIEGGFTDREVLDRNYNGDLHNLIIGKIEKVLIRED